MTDYQLFLAGKARTAPASGIDCDPGDVAVTAPRYPRGRPKKPLDSDRYGRLTVMDSVPGGWRCRCDCGTEVTVTGSNLRTGQTTSCGCYHRERQREAPRKHGLHDGVGYGTWLNMRQRCTNPANPSWKNYGGRGITICDAWDDFGQFIRDVGEPEPGQTLDRIDNDGNYEPGNVQWATRAAQNRNKRANRMIELGGVTKCLADWCDELGLNYWTVHARLRRGASNEEALRP